VNFGTSKVFAPEMEKTREKLDGVPRSQGTATAEQPGIQESEP
jgi:hypothetical protein